jgi:formylglycine-generating enzyme required for sulfatase activity
VVDWGGPPDKQREWLSQLAFEMHQRGAAGATADEGQARAVLSPLLERRGELPLLERFIAAVRGRGGLFEERGDRFQFMHLTFQEFLAAQHLARQWAALPDHEKFLAQVVADGWWREALLLTVGSLGAPAPYEQRETFIAALCGLSGSPEARLAAAELSATGLLDLTEPEPMLLDTARRRLVALLTAPSLNQVTPPKRAVAADALARLGDPRPGVGVDRETDLPDILWCYVPPGPFVMGDGEEQHQNKTLTEGYLISRYPITNAQFAVLVKAGGYQERQYWVEAERDGIWAEGRLKAWGDDQPREGPRNYGELLSLPNHPVVGVTWYEAVAYCRWLQERLQVADSALQVWHEGELKALNLRPVALHVQLPSETEWEKAARGTDGRRFPWGEEVDPNRANYSDTGIGTTSAVGCFPGGASVYGAEDLSGNVWEWTRSLYREYPYHPEDGRENLEAGQEVRRVMRGGAFFNVARGLCCAFRHRYSPNYLWPLLGFRVVASPVHL